MEVRSVQRVGLETAESVCLRDSPSETVPVLGQAQDEAVDWPETRSGQVSEIESGRLTSKKLLRARRNRKPNAANKQKHEMEHQTTVNIDVLC